MVKEARAQLYEGMYIVSTTLSEDARGKVMEGIEKGIKEVGGEVHKTINWGRKRLAYPIDGKREGHYYLLYFTAPSLSISDLWKEYRLNADLLRFLTLQAEEVRESIEFKALAGV